MTRRLTLDWLLTPNSAGAAASRSMHSATTTTTTAAIMTMTAGIELSVRSTGHEMQGAEVVPVTSPSHRLPAQRWLRETRACLLGEPRRAARHCARACRELHDVLKMKVRLDIAMRAKRHRCLAATTGDTSRATLVRRGTVTQFQPSAPTIASRSLRHVPLHDRGDR